MMFMTIRDIGNGNQNRAAIPAVTLTYRASEHLVDEIECEMLLPVEKTCFSRMTNYNGEGQVIENGFVYPVNSFLSAYAERKDVAVRKFIRPLMDVYDEKGFRRFFDRMMNDITEDEKEALERLLPYFENKHGWENPINKYVYRKYLLPNVPKFLYYDEYFIMPSRVSIDRLAKHTDLTDSEYTAKALLLLADINLEKIAGILKPAGRNWSSCNRSLQKIF